MPEGTPTPSPVLSSLSRSRVLDMRATEKRAVVASEDAVIIDHLFALNVERAEHARVASASATPTKVPTRGKGKKNHLLARISRSHPRTNDMACPDFQSLTLPILQVASSGGELTMAQLRSEAARRLNLSEADLAEKIPSGRQSRFNNRANWACIYMSEAGVLEWVRRGTYRITQRGRDILANPPPRIDIAFLSKFDEFRAWKNKRGDDTKPSLPPKISTDGETPEEQIEDGYEALRRSVEAELIQKILAAQPRFFEELVVELLVKMGYGGSRDDAGEALGKSGDGGVDGIIKEDKLGLDAIYIQAKRWDPAKHKVSRPDVQAFAGSLEGHRARKGVFITTSSFSTEAHDYVARIEKKIILIDGPHLARLLFDHGVGVRTKQTYEVKEVDEEYFLDD